MRKVILLDSILILMAFSSFAQIKYGKEPLEKKNEIQRSNLTKSPNKEKTEEWILNKFKKFSEEKFSSSYDFNSYERNYRFYFDSNFFVIEFKQVAYPRNGSAYYDSLLILCQTKVPVYDIKEIQCSTNGLYINTVKSTISQMVNNKTTVSSFCTIGFTCDSKTDLIERMNKAFLNLKKYYSKPVSNELF